MLRNSTKHVYFIYIQIFEAANGMVMIRKKTFIPNLNRFYKLADTILVLDTLLTWQHKKCIDNNTSR